jgi:hypothetical protein
VHKGIPGPNTRLKLRPRVTNGLEPDTLFNYLDDNAFPLEVGHDWNC